MPTRKAQPSIYELKITLLEIDPPIWRRIQVPSTILLSNLHDLFQIAMGWTDSHLHQFEKDGTFWGQQQLYEVEDLDVADEAKVPISRILKAEGDSMVYVYDFGDDWRHEVVLEKILPSEPLPTPVCVAGERKCPPEDTGGPHGYREFLEVIFDPSHEEYEHYRGWAGGKFHAEEFDLKAVNKTLDRVRSTARRRR